MRQVTVAAVSCVFVLAFGASSALAQASRNTKVYAAPRTAWGDPDLQGTYTNSDESGIPMQRPAELAGRSLADVTPAELAKLIDQRRAQTERTAKVIGGTADNDTGAGPSHWYENYNAKNSRAWMVSDPSDGRVHHRIGPRRAPGAGRGVGMVARADLAPAARPAAHGPCRTPRRQRFSAGV